MLQVFICVKSQYLKRKCENQKKNKESNIESSNRTRSEF